MTNRSKTCHLVADTAHIIFSCTTDSTGGVLWNGPDVAACIARGRMTNEPFKVWMNQTNIDVGRTWVHIGSYGIIPPTKAELEQQWIDAAIDTDFSTWCLYAAWRRHTKHTAGQSLTR